MQSPLISSFTPEELIVILNVLSANDLSAYSKYSNQHLHTHLAQTISKRYFNSMLVHSGFSPIYPRPNVPTGLRLSHIRSGYEPDSNSGYYECTQTPLSQHFANFFDYITI